MEEKSSANETGKARNRKFGKRIKKDSICVSFRDYVRLLHTHSSSSAQTVSFHPELEGKERVPHLVMPIKCVIVIRGAFNFGAFLTQRV